MNKREATAILGCQTRILKALEICERQLGGGQEAGYAEAYWLTHIKNNVLGMGYGSMPVARAAAVMEGLEAEATL